MVAVKSTNYFVNPAPFLYGETLTDGAPWSIVYYFWLRSVDTSGNEGPWAAPMSGFSSGQASAFGVAQGVMTGTALPDAFTVPAIAELASPVALAGLNGPLLSVSFTLASAATVMLAGTVEQSYSGSPQTWSFALWADSDDVQVWSDLVGISYQVGLAGSVGVSLSAGAHTSYLYWDSPGNSSGITAEAATLSVTGIQR